MKSSIPSELKVVISKSVKLLGQAILELYGVKHYREIEKLRMKMKTVRGETPQIVEEALFSVYKDLRKKNNQELHQICKSLSLMLELINCCEAAYRTGRLKDYKWIDSKKPHSLIFVFTSHPTEARSKNFLLILNKIEELLLAAFTSGIESVELELLYLFKLALNLDLAKNRRPSVKDEAEQIYHFVLDESILKEQIALRQKDVHVQFRTWVGGDKDGHPGVGEKSMLESLTLSRLKILEYIEKTLVDYRDEISLVNTDCIKKINNLIRELKGLRKITAGDGGKITKYRAKILSFISACKKTKLCSPGLLGLIDLLWLYPALVLPLEVREDHELIHQAVSNPGLAIAKMLKLLRTISKGYEHKWYVRGFVISMCESADDIVAAVKLTKKMTGDLCIPVIPLFENQKGLLGSVDILSEAFKQYAFVSAHKKKWGGRFEVMLGYSDSSKESGVLPGRLLVEQGIFKIEKHLLKHKLTPVFFHGSGGSVSRGGGSVKEQIAWLPQTALNIYKATIQGETVQRHFHQPLIMRSQVSKIVNEFANFKPQETVKSLALPKFSNGIQDSYMALVKDNKFQEMVSKVTPYDFLNVLRIGSRPTKRSGKGEFTIRAIPWILCWTQTRLLLPMWWGLGSSWENLSRNDKDDLKKYYKRSPLMQSYVKNLGFTLAKIDLGVWHFHLENSRLDAKDKKYWRKIISSELDGVRKFFKEISGQDSYTWFRPMLGESIIFRSSMIHPLNIIQKISLERGDNFLLREAVTGIASGMLTTG